MIRAAKKDDNHAEIAKFFKDNGWSVLDISQLKNCADIIIGRGLQTVIIEIKDGKKPPSQRKLTAGEFKFSKEWCGEYREVHSINDAMDINQKFFGAKILK